MSHQSAALSSRSNSISLADWAIGHFTSSLPRRLRCLYLGTSHILVCPLLSLLLVNPLEFHNVDPVTVSHVDNDLDWVDAPIPAFTLVFQTPSPVADHNSFNNHLAEALWQLSENLNWESAPKPYQSKTCIPDTFNSSGSHKLNHFLF